MVITLTILNSSSADLSITDGELTAGIWLGPSPVPGKTLASGYTSYVNASGSTFGSAGGYIVLTPAAGGTVNLSWGWTPKNGVIAYGSISGTSALVLAYSITNASTYNPTVTYVITDPGVGETAGDPHARRPV